MISICIPVYNVKVEQLVNDLSRQGDRLKISYEIVLIDDFSSAETRKVNKRVCEDHKYILLEKNRGRAGTRNLFPEYSQYGKLLFVDCDSTIISENYLKNYLNTIRELNPDIICGGSLYRDQPPGRNKRLRWKYGREKESRVHYIRQKYPYTYFTGNNFIIDRKIFDRVRFDDRITEYGYEDTLFAWELYKNGVKICHIENPLLNDHTDDNIVYLKKTEQAVSNLVKILYYIEFDKTFIRKVTILDFYYKLSAVRMSAIFRIFFLILRPVIRYMLVKGFASLPLFDIYKLGMLSVNFRKER